MMQRVDHHPVAIPILVFLVRWFFSLASTTQQVQTQRRLQTSCTAELRGAENLHGLHTYIAHYLTNDDFISGERRREKFRHNC